MSLCSEDVRPEAETPEFGAAPPGVVADVGVEGAPGV